MLTDLTLFSTTAYYPDGSHTYFDWALESDLPMSQLSQMRVRSTVHTVQSGSTVPAVQSDLPMSYLSQMRVRGWCVLTGGGPSTPAPLLQRVPGAHAQLLLCQRLQAGVYAS